MFTYETQIRVRYADTDQMGYMYYGNYATYYEVCRTEALRSLGLNYREMEKQGVMLPVLELHNKFIRPAHYDDLLTVKTMIKTLPDGMRITFFYEVINEAGTLINHGKTTLVFVDMKTGKPTIAPKEIVEVLQPFFTEENISEDS
ncbi:MULTISPECIES: acyl-CoA thioesterase [Persicobacter]|uniref:Thioesterase n=1 Tax=Persicobacter diffluens TaxID=981 RepID=A0AAN5AKP3_9BACT|nr:thioesterase family protein [Persicobacter sp. CCB-QB2]GJM62022.1 thioesterase [Persicobacter diffluens]